MLSFFKHFKVFQKSHYCIRSSFRHFFACKTKNVNLRVEIETELSEPMTCPLFITVRERDNIVHWNVPVDFDKTNA